ncbi:MAG: ACT domain-containing protein [Planctomycetota bacterium]|nr:MAG: ACT domain-containing protein [Planctomycetota bacterium]
MSDQEPGLLSLEWIPGRFAVCRLGADEAVPDWALASGSSGLVSVTRTDRELSIVASEERVPASTRAERGWVALRVGGTLDFGLVGVLSRLTGALAAAGVSVFAVSTYDTDILLVKAKDSQRALEALGVVADCSSL